MWMRDARLNGDGWHRGEDGVWRLDAHARARVRGGKGAAPAHQRGGAVLDVDTRAPDGADALGLGREVAKLPAGETRLTLRGGGGSPPVRPGDRVECGRCGGRNTVAPALLEPSTAALEKLRGAGFA
jgi:hypothetical protein